ncbi:MAG: nucleotidyltransferase domain-containing protein [Anaerolineales bacterium]|nr:nucleotidyltransferase domain-containing protein [Anaerolineales bacterium]
MLKREQILETIKAKLEPLAFVNAMWEGGSAAFGRVDEFSDIDLLLDVADEKVAETFDALEDALRQLSPITDTYEIPQPTWHGHHQRFYRLQKASDYLLIDCAITKQSSQNKFLEQEIHGRHLVHFDKTGVVQSPPWDEAAWQERLRKRLAELIGFFPITANFPEKELRRKHPMDALSYYNGLILRPLVELLRMKYDPSRHHFGTRYLYTVLPPEEVKQLEGLMFVGSPEALLVNTAVATDWFWALADELDEQLDIPEEPTT